MENIRITTLDTFMCCSVRYVNPEFIWISGIFFSDKAQHYLKFKSYTKFKTLFRVYTRKRKRHIAKNRFFFYFFETQVNNDSVIKLLSWTKYQNDLYMYRKYTWSNQSPFSIWMEIEVELKTHPNPPLSCIVYIFFNSIN